MRVNMMTTNDWTTTILDDRSLRIINHELPNHWSSRIEQPWDLMKDSSHQLIFNHWLLNYWALFPGIHPNLLLVREFIIKSTHQWLLNHAPSVTYHMVDLLVIGRKNTWLNSSASESLMTSMVSHGDQWWLMIMVVTKHGDEQWWTMVAKNYW